MYDNCKLRADKYMTCVLLYLDVHYHTLTCVFMHSDVRRLTIMCVIVHHTFSDDIVHRCTIIKRHIVCTGKTDRENALSHT